jgi:hypothetical protein
MQKPMPNSDLTWLDLCSGLGGASQPALDRGWRVIRVDIDPRFKPDIVADVRALPLKPFHVDVLWASPPCDAFSRWSFPESWACNKNGKQIPDTSLVKAIRDCEIVADWWIIENVRASKPFLTPLLGPIFAEIDGHVFWGRAPGLLPQVRGHKWKLPPTPDRSALRAKIPYEIGSAICAAVERRHDA